MIGTDLSNVDLIGVDLSGVNLNDVISDKRYISISLIGSRKGTSVYCFNNDHIWCGCFKGSLDDFEQAITKTHANNKQALKEYIGMIQYIRSLI